MAAEALPAPRRHPLARNLAARAGRTARLAVRRVLAPHRAALANLRDIPLTAAGLACGDVAAWMWHPIAGVACLMPLLIFLEHLIADEK